MFSGMGGFQPLDFLAKNVSKEGGEDAAESVGARVVGDCREGVFWESKWSACCLEDSSVKPALVALPWHESLWEKQEED